MKRIFFLTLLLSLCLTACGPSEAPTSEGEAPPAVPTGALSQEDPTEDIHTLSKGGNVLEHEKAGYCGNTITTVTGPEGDQVSFWGGDSVELTDLLLYLDYSEGICRCRPEYTVDTEFGTGYGVNLTGSYARHEGGQTALTEEQVKLIREIIDRQFSGDGGPYED